LKKRRIGRERASTIKKPWSTRGLRFLPDPYARDTSVAVKGGNRAEKGQGTKETEGLGEGHASYGNETQKGEGQIREKAAKKIPLRKRSEWHGIVI